VFTDNLWFILGLYSSRYLYQSILLYVNLMLISLFNSRMYLINTSLKNIKAITLLLICFFSFSAFANDVPKFLEMKGYAEQGDVKAQYNLAFMYYKGKGVTQDYKQAVKWYRKAAEQGYASAQFNLAFMYDKGKGVTQDYKQAVKWYLIAAEQGDVKAQYNLAFMYDKGQGVIQDYKQSVKWYRKAAEQGNVRAQYNLAIMYRKGRGVIQSNNNSYIWNAIAAANGNERAIINRDLDAKILSPRGIEEAQEEAAKLYEKIYNK